MERTIEDEGEQTNVSTEDRVAGNITDSRLRPVRDYLAAVGLVALITVLGRLLFGTSEPADAAMLYILGEVVASLLLARGPALLTAGLSVLAFDFVFIPPYMTLQFAALRHIVTFAAMLVVGFVINLLIRRLRSQTEASKAQELKTRTLYEMTRELTTTNDRRELAERAARHVGLALDAHVAVLERDAGTGAVPVILYTDRPLELDALERQRIVSELDGESTHGVDRSAGEPPGVAYLAVPSHSRPLAVLRVAPRGRIQLADPAQKELLDALAAQLGLALERAYLDEERGRARLAAERERVRSSLLAAVSHDLRTPLFVIEGASSTLLELGPSLDPEVSRQLLVNIRDEADRLGHLVNNLLEMTRFGAGELVPNRDWHVLEEIVGSALTRMGPPLEGRPLSVELPADLPMIAVDDVLIEQVLINLLENVVRYTPPESPLALRAQPQSGADGGPEVVVEVVDSGPGLDDQDLDRLFERFYRGSASTGKARGVGLGLSVCRALIEAHGGWIEASNRPEGGACFRFAIPVDAGQPDSLQEMVRTMERA